MKLVKLSLAAAAVLALAPQISTAAGGHQPGQGWDVFRSGEGEMVSHQAYQGTSMGNAGQGWDVFNARSGGEEPLPSGNARYQGTSAARTGQGWDVFRSGEGEPI